MPHQTIEGVKPVKHKTFTVLCYLPGWDKKYCDWVYGADFIEALKGKFNVIVVDGSYDMEKVYPHVDLYVKYNRWEIQWTNRIALECRDLGIPVFRTDYKQTDSENFKRLQATHEPI